MISATARIVMDDHTIEQVSSRTVYQSRYMRLREDDIRRPDGSLGVYSYVEKPDCAMIMPMENDGFHLVEQYRYPIRRRSWEFPQGSLPGVSPAPPTSTAAEFLAREELRQETGLSAATLRHLGRLHYASGMTDQAFDVFLATELTHGEAELEVEEQDLRHRWFPRERVERMIRDGAITDDATLAAYTLFLLDRADSRTPAAALDPAERLPEFDEV